MSLNRIQSGLVISVIIVLMAACSPPGETPDIHEPAAVKIDKAFINGNIYTFTWRAPDKTGTPAVDAPYRDGRWQADAEAIAISGGQIVAVGSNAEIKALGIQSSQIIDLNGATVIPGLIDSHVHIAELGEILSRINLIDQATPLDVIRKIQSSLASQPVAKGDWIIGQGWDEGAWASQYPDKQLLDAAFPENPVYLKSLHGFAVWVNSAALKAAGIDAQTLAPVGGEIRKTSTGEPSGILLNRATTLMQAAVPEPTEQQFQDWVLTGLKQMANDGYVAVHEAGAESRHIRAFQSLQQGQQLPIRVYAMLSARDESLAQFWLDKGPYTDSSGWLDIRSVKAYYDGALGSRGARLLEDYSDTPGHRGVAGDGYGFDQQRVRQLMDKGFQVGIHAIGDAGNRETLDFLEAVYRDNPATRNYRHRIEHAQIIHPQDIDRLAKLDLIASMEPAHAVEDKTWAEDRLGEVRIKGAYAWRSLIKAGTRLTLNSDLPGSDHNFFYTLHSAVTRQDKVLQPEGGWYPEQNLSAEETIRAMTQGAAYAAFRETQTGVIAAGQWADLTMIDQDVMQVAAENPAALFDSQIVMTVVNGQIVYQR